MKHSDLILAMGELDEDLILAVKEDMAMKGQKRKTVRLVLVVEAIVAVAGLRFGDGNTEFSVPVK